MTDATWPAVEWEELAWRGAPRAEWGIAAARTAFRPVYSAAIPPLIAELDPVVDKATMELADESARELTRFDAVLGPSIAAFAPVLLRSEAASSSQIEHLTASARAILTAEYGPTSSRNAMLIASNTRALSAAIDLADSPTPDSIRAMHATLMEHEPRHTPGEFRQEPVWIGSDPSTPVGAHFVPPRHERLDTLMTDLAAFAHRVDVQPMVQVALAHAQFETIHPFTDGNGRTGRAFAQSMLRRRGVTRNVAVPVSAGLLASTDEYHAALDAYRRGEASPIVHMLSTASLTAIANSEVLIQEIGDVKDGWRQELKLRAGSTAERLLEVIARRPVLDAKTAAFEVGTQPSNVYPALRQLEGQGVLAKKSEYRLGTFWRCDAILAAVDRFAKRAGRRQW